MTKAREPVQVLCGLEKRVVKLFIDISPIWIILWLLMITMYIGSLIIKSFGSKNYVHLSVGRFFDRLHFFFEPRNSCRIAIDLISINAHAQRTRLNLSCIQTCYWLSKNYRGTEYSVINGTHWFIGQKKCYLLAKRQKKLENSIFSKNPNLLRKCRVCWRHPTSASGGVGSPKPRKYAAPGPRPGRSLLSSNVPRRSVFFSEKTEKCKVN